LIKELGVHVAMLGAPAPSSDFTFAQQIEEEVKHTNSTTEGLLCALSPDPQKPTWPPRRILTFAQNCDLVISPDTGPAWAVAMEQVPKIVLHSHASVQNITTHWINTTSLHADPIRVPCWSCHQLHNQPSTCIEEQRRCGMDIKPDAEKLGAACINDITVEMIVATARQLLGSVHV
jgi:ADP-heptose:LPS heptosyltransferase